MSACGKSLAVAWALPAPTAGFEPDPAYPSVTLADFWRRWYEMFILGQYPPGTVWLCKVPLPDYAGDPGLARAAADKLGATYTAAMSAEEVCDQIIAIRGYPPLTQ